MLNASLLTRTFSNSLKTAVVKSNLDNIILSNYRPISNLHFIGKIIEKVVFCHGSWVRVLIPCVRFVWVCHVWQPRILIRGYTCSLFHCLYLDRSFTILCQFVCFRSPVCFSPWLPVCFFVIRALLLLGFVSSSAGLLFCGPLFYELGRHPWN